MAFIQTHCRASLKIITPFPIFATSRLILRQHEEADYQKLFLLRSEESVNKFLARQHWMASKLKTKPLANHI